MPFNMAANEVLANRANEILTGYKGSDQVHPNTHVNMCQSSNDVVPTAKGIAIHNEVGRVLKAAAHLEAALDAKAAEFADVVKMGRTCLQDAVPITLGQEFSGYAAGIRRNRLLLERERARWCTSVLGATAVGTGMGCMPGFSEHIYKNLSAVCGREIRRDANLFDGLQASDSFIILHAHLQALATVAAKAALDIRLMGSGPRAGFGDIVIPAVQPGSSIMPGKINPVMTEVMILACHRVAGNQAGVGLGLLRGAGPRRLLRRADPQHPQQYRHPEPQHGALRGQVCEGPFRQCRKMPPYGRTLDLAGDDGKCALRLQDRQPCGQSGVRTQYYWRRPPNGTPAFRSGARTIFLICCR